VPQLQLLLRGHPHRLRGTGPPGCCWSLPCRIPQTCSGRPAPLAGERHEIRVRPAEPAERPLPRDPPSRPVSGTRTGYGPKGGHPHRLRNV